MPPPPIRTLASPPVEKEVAGGAGGVGLVAGPPILAAGGGEALSAAPGNAGAFGCEPALRNPSLFIVRVIGTPEYKMSTFS
jgi:hypothetical protein